MAQQEGLDISERTLRYWAKEKLIPPPEFNRDRRACYPISLIERLRLIDQLRQPRTLHGIKQMVEEIETLKIGDRTFCIIRDLGEIESENHVYAIREIENGQYLVHVRRKT